MPASVHELAIPGATRQTSNEPLAATLFTKSLRLAFLTSDAVMPDGRVERSNLIKLFFVEVFEVGAVMESAVPLPKLLIGLVESVYESSLRQASTPANEMRGQSSAPVTNTRAVSTPFVSRTFFRMTSSLPSVPLPPSLEGRAAKRGHPSNQRLS